MTAANPTDAFIVKSIQPAVSDDGQWVCLSVTNEDRAEIDVLIPLAAFQAAVSSIARLGAAASRGEAKMEIPAREGAFPLHGYLLAKEEGLVRLVMDAKAPDGCHMIPFEFTPQVAGNLADALLATAADVVTNKN